MSPVYAVRPAASGSVSEETLAKSTVKIALADGLHGRYYDGTYIQIYIETMK
ncbi:MAG: hypothetical protein LUE11_06345 [Clostridia bacterium]|nr:hypothetical protein [Clostridia bacterium]